MSELFKAVDAAKRMLQHPGVLWISEDAKLICEELVELSEFANPYLPEAPDNMEHKLSGSPTDLGGNYRCTLCGAYYGSKEYELVCQGRFAESGKMRSWARTKWEKDLDDEH